MNKSMLNSHLKSHSTVYQYRCSTCGYATKYCHSLKLHLRKYGHEPAEVLNPDGTPNLINPTIDVYGTRRGPRVKSETNEAEHVSPNQPNFPNLNISMSRPENLTVTPPSSVGSTDIWKDNPPNFDFTSGINPAFVQNTLYQQLTMSQSRLYGHPGYLQDEANKVHIEMMKNNSKFVEYLRQAHKIQNERFGPNILEPYKMQSEPWSVTNVVASVTGSDVGKNEVRNFCWIEFVELNVLLGMKVFVYKNWSW